MGKKKKVWLLLLFIVTLQFKESQWLDRIFFLKWGFNCSWLDRLPCGDSPVSAMLIGKTTICKSLVLKVSGTNLMPGGPGYLMPAAT